MEKERRELLDKMLRAVGLELVELPEHFSKSWHFACERVDKRGDGWISFSEGNSVKLSSRNASSVSYSLYVAPRLFASREDVFEKLGKAKCFVWQSLRSMSHLGEHEDNKEWKVWENPFFGCMSDDEVRVRMDLLCIGEQDAREQAE